MNVMVIIKHIILAWGFQFDSQFIYYIKEF